MLIWDQAGTACPWRARYATVGEDAVNSFNLNWGVFELTGAVSRHAAHR